MINKNNGIDESDVWQNKFTAYLLVAIQRKKASYLHKQSLKLNNEIIPGEDFLAYLPIEEDFLKNSSALELLEDLHLLRTLQDLKTRDLQIFLLKAVEGQTFAEIAQGFDLGYNGVTAVYYRVLKKLQEELGGEAK